MKARTTRSVIACMLFVWTTIACIPCKATDICPRTDREQPWSSTCFTGDGAKRHVKPAYIDRIVGNAGGFAMIHLADVRELLVVDRTGLVTIPHIAHTGDFDYPDASAGLGRFYLADADMNGKPARCGYFDSRTLTVAIAPIYDHCMAAQSGTARVCVGCTSYCTEPDCQDSVFTGGTGLLLDRHNKIVRRFVPPPLNETCGTDTGAPKIFARGRGSPYLQCPAPTSGPFSKLR